MVSPPDKEQNEQFVRLARVFAEAGVPVPEVLASEALEGWYILTDLGAEDLEAAYAGVARDAALSAAIETLIQLQNVRDPAIAPYTAERFSAELDIFADWFVDRTLGQQVPDEVRAVFQILVNRAGEQHQCCVHRDYHCRNLLFTGNDGGGAIGVVDFQDALIGPVSYDLASLLHDCYYEFSPVEIARWTAHFLATSKLQLDPSAFAVDVDYMAVQRQLKAVGIFTRLKLRDSKSTHLTYITPVLDRVRLLAQSHAELAPLGDWLEHLPSAPALARLANSGAE